jgi:hypothetical protein
MRISLLRIIHTTLLRRADKLHYYDFPKTLRSLTIDNPNKIQISKDVSEINSHFRHPVFIDFVPTYEELVKNKELAWLTRYSKSQN